MSESLSHLDATAQAELVRSGQASATELVEAAIARCEKLAPELGFLVTPLYEQARQEAAGELPDGPFRGVPFLTKDLVCARAGDPLYMGNRALRDADFRAVKDTFLARRFRNAGLVNLGRTKTPEFGWIVTTEPEAHGPARNPWNRDHSTGGSSGGSAAAVAARVVPLAHANDGGGSIRIPASECGLVGLKPSRGRVSVGPDFGEFWHGLAIEGVVSLSVRDTAGALDAMAGPEVGDLYAAPTPVRAFADEVGALPGSLRVGILSHRPDGGAVDPACAEAVAAVGRLLEALGHRVEVAHPNALEELEAQEAFATVFFAHAARTWEEVSEVVGRPLDAEDFEAYSWNLIQRGRQVRTGEYIAANDWLHRWTRRVAEFWASGFDLLVTPTLGEPPPQLGELASAAASWEALLERGFELSPFTWAYNVTGQPALSLPLYWSSADLPVGVQFVSAYGREDLLLRLGAQVEAAQPWIDRLPPVCA